MHFKLIHKNLRVSLNSSKEFETMFGHFEVKGKERSDHNDVWAVDVIA